MSKRVRKHAPVLHALSKAKPKLAKKIIEHAENDLIHCICECALNVLKGNLHLTPAHKKRLRRHLAGLRALVDRKKSLPAKRKVIQRGGCLGALLGAIIPAIGGLISSIASR